ncbi:hypothetical protein QX204_34365 (plasmid) [Nocardia sp. PE-7]|uniref:hypothetical protein n=1 Tax=Nocardia sp. PE-7 TaxID=3058426 RepID=UPI00265AD580|nr:hypothetical protein [Nocardia sp. PE-7]WKG13571.1 hypothetical protein QX204_34365 [Nocardia sp. PE-7]
MSEPTESAKIALPPRRSRRGPAKRPFSTQLQASTMARLDWIVSQGYALTDITDAAITAYLDAAGVPVPDSEGRMPDPSKETKE